MHDCLHEKKESVFSSKGSSLGVLDWLSFVLLVDMLRRLKLFVKNIL